MSSSQVDLALESQGQTAFTGTVQQRIATTRLADALGPWRLQTGPLSRRLADSIADLASLGVLPPGSLLPAERPLGEALGVSRNTMAAAFGHLVSDGWLTLEARRGARVTPPSATGDMTPWSNRTANLFTSTPGGVIDLGVASAPPASCVVPVAQQVWAELDPHRVAGYAPEGIPSLIDAVVLTLRSDGVRAERDEIVITNGAHDAIGLVSSTLGRASRPIALEALTYPGAIDACSTAPSSGLLGIPVTNGFDVDAATRITAASRPSMLYLTSYHNPTGHRGPEDADALCALSPGITIVEDRALADLRINQPAAVPLASRHSGADIVTIGSTSKLFWGGLRIGWIQTNRTLAARLRNHRARRDLGSPVGEQLIAAKLLTEHRDAAARERTRRLAATLGLVQDFVNAHHGWQLASPDGGPVA